GPEPVEHLPVAQVDARHVVPHLGQRERDRAHPRAGDTDHVEASRYGEVDRGGRGGGFGGDAHDTGQAIATDSTRWAKAPLRCSSPLVVAAAESAARSSGECRSRSMTAERRSTPSSGRKIAAPSSDNHRTFIVWWSTAAPDHVTSTAGTPVTATSCTVLAPPRPTSRSAAAYTRGMSDSYPTGW